jgi:thiol-disulfide isomerase/thioredoxin
MREFKTLSLLLLMSGAAIGQAPDFMETDLDGITHNLYSDYLNQGKAVYIDLSATWCGPCIELHERGYFNEFYDLHGPNGYDDGHVLLIESDASTPPSSLYGPGGNYNWVEESNYPVIDDADESVYDDYEGAGYPTICLVCPDRTYYKDNEAGLYWTDIVSAQYLEDKMYEMCGNSIIPQNDLDAALLGITSLNTYCGENYYPKVEVRNVGTEPITSIEFEVYVDNNLASNYTWSGTLLTFDKIAVNIPYIMGTGTNMNLEVVISTVNGQQDAVSSNNALTKTVDVGYHSLYGDEVNIVAHIDQMGWQCQWQFIDPEDNVVGEVNYYPTGDLEDPLPEPEDYTFTGLSSGCYTFHAYDALANGLVDFSLTEWGSGPDPTIYYPTPGFVFTDVNGDYMGSLQTFDYFNDYSILVGADATGGYTSVDELTGLNELSVYPNPAQSELYIQSEGLQDGELELINLLGESVPIATNLLNADRAKIDVSHLPSGIYFLRLSIRNTSITTKIIVN